MQQATKDLCSTHSNRMPALDARLETITWPIPPSPEIAACTLDTPAAIQLARLCISFNGCAGNPAVTAMR